MPCFYFVLLSIPVMQSAPAPGKNFDAAPASALLYRKQKLLQTNYSKKYSTVQNYSKKNTVRG
jgi:hypothetical protein